MKKSTTFVLLIFLSSISFAQEFKQVKFGIGLGYTNTLREDSFGGLLDFEPAVRINDEFAIGFRLGFDLVARNDVELEDYQAQLFYSVSINGYYYFSNGKFRPYAGIGAGLYLIQTLGFFGISLENKFGFYPRIGFDLGHFNFNIDYHIISPSEVDFVSFFGIPLENVRVKNSYIGVRLGVFFGGGRIKGEK